MSHNNKIEKTKMMGEGEISKVLTKMSVPGIIAMLINAIYNIVDSMFIGMLGNTEAMGATSVIFPLFMLIAALGQMFGVGAGSYIARLLGAGNKNQAEKVVSTTFYTTIIMSILFTVSVLTLINPTLRILGATDTIMPYALTYGKILVTGAIFTIINMTLNNTIRAEGNAKYSMIAISLGAVLNVILDPLFMFGFDMGIKGAAISTVLSTSISSIYLLRYYFSGKSFIKITREKFTPKLSLYSEIMKVGGATFARQALASLSLGILNSKAAFYGDSTVAAMGISTRVTSAVLYIVIGYNQGFMPIAAYNYGAEKYDRLKSAIRISLIRLTVFCTFATFIFMFFTEDILRLFSSDPEVIERGKAILRAMSILIPTLGFQQIYAVLYQALGKSVGALVLSSARQGTFLILALMILPSLLNFRGLIYSQASADIFTVITTLIFAIKISKEIKDKEDIYKPSNNLVLESNG
ncbi:MATE family efflux transporter [Ilyobacter polytropus]|uniref:Multidrug export protein MepA n=1 Tax=Ilyobacter polytropus (strain ATCC 51220 / DSM 2926 / LMG 16218 / CuHBu1) TaxID=572544 RepID=E3HA49_ILYPC|nr:MATE family efflux transporter [Ilyobacter polytropus]ADO83454.1 MATE efflux family protein [Ilyobacter polytropus DSM 2926]